MRKVAAGGMLVLFAGLFMNCQNFTKTEVTESKQQALNGETPWVDDWSKAAIVEEVLEPQPPEVNVTFEPVDCGDSETFSRTIRQESRTFDSGSEARDDCIARLRADAVRGARCDHQVCEACASERACSVRSVSTRSISVDCRRSDDEYRCTCRTSGVRVSCNDCGVD